MGPSKAQAGVSEVLKLLYFVWFPAHRLFLSSERLNLGQDASRWPKTRSPGGNCYSRGSTLRPQNWSPGVRQVGTRVIFVLYFTHQNSFRVNRKRNLVTTQGVTYIMPMCVLYCILHIRMLLWCAAVAAVFGYEGVF